MNTRLLIILVMSVLGQVPPRAHGSDSDARLAPEPGGFSVTGFSEDADLSGLARAGDWVLVVADEGTSVQLGRIDDAAGTIRMESSLVLEPARKKKDGGGELDLEAVCYAAAERAFYVTGSHGVGKKKGEVEPRRFGVYRIPFDPDRGMLRASEVSRSSLLPWLETSDDFKSSVRQPLQRNGFNIEGLAWAGGRLYFGTRGPVKDGTSHVIEVEAAALFADGGRGIAPLVHRVAVGEDAGIRDLLAEGESLYIVSGNASAEPSKQFPMSLSRRPDAEFVLWRMALPMSGGQPLTPITPTKLGNVGAPEGKVEGLMVLARPGPKMRLLFLHDGLPQGGASVYGVDSIGP